MLQLGKKYHLKGLLELYHVPGKRFFVRIQILKIFVLGFNPGIPYSRIPGIPAVFWAREIPAGNLYFPGIPVKPLFVN